MVDETKPVPLCSIYELSKSVAAAVADKVMIRVEVTNIPNFAEQVSNLVATKVLLLLRQEAETKEAAAKAKRKPKPKRKAAKK